MITDLENKYADLLINRCLNFKKSKSLFISYFDDNQEFVNKIVQWANKIGVNDIYLNVKNKEEHKCKLLQSIEEINEDEYFDESIWDEYAKKNSAFLILSTEFPHYFEDVPSANISAAAFKMRNTKPIYKKKQELDEISWCIAVMPNNIWAKDKFPNLDALDAYKKLFELMMNCTMVTSDNPIKNWNDFLKKQALLTEKLNKLNITSLHYINSLGTDLKIILTKNVIWRSAGSTKDMIVNMPTYEVFTSPDYRYTKGIVYSSRPLMYSGALIDKFWLKFKDGKVIDYDALVGKDILKGIIESDEYSSFLGEVALVSKNTAIAKTNFVFGETCLDENASCHLALGTGFLECVLNGEMLSVDERRKIGLNFSSNHVDFMIGTDDLNIWAETNKGKVLIFKDGDFNI